VGAEGLGFHVFEQETTCTDRFTAEAAHFVTDYARVLKLDSCGVRMEARNA